MKKSILTFFILYYLCTSCSLFCIGCKPEGKRREIIKDFIETLVQDDSHDIHNLNKYLETNTKSEFYKNHPETNKLNQMIKIYLTMLTDELKGKEYQILTYEAFKEKFKRRIKYKNETDETDIYCIVIKDGFKDVFLTPIIFNRKNKIVSFFTGITKGGNNYYPIYLLEKELQEYDRRKKRHKSNDK